MSSSKTAKKKPTKKRIIKKIVKKPIKKKITRKKVIKKIPKKVKTSRLDKLIREVTEEEIGLDDIDTLIDIVAHWGPKAYNFATNLASKYLPLPMF